MEPLIIYCNNIETWGWYLVFAFVIVCQHNKTNRRPWRASAVWVVSAGGEPGTDASRLDCVPSIYRALRGTLVMSNKLLTVSGCLFPHADTQTDSDIIRSVTSNPPWRTDSRPKFPRFTKMSSFQRAGTSFHKDKTKTNTLPDPDSRHQGCDESTRKNAERSRNKEEQHRISCKLSPNMEILTKIFSLLSHKTKKSNNSSHSNLSLDMGK